MSFEETEARRDEREAEGVEPGPCRRGRCFWFLPWILLAIAAKGALFMLLWNALVPDLFGGPALKYLEALGLLFLAKMVFGFRGHPGGWRGKFGPHAAMRKRFWARMSPEERNKLREHLRKRWE